MTSEQAQAWDHGWAARAEFEQRGDVPLNWPDLNPYRPGKQDVGRPLCPECADEVDRRRRVAHAAQPQPTTAEPKARRAMKAHRLTSGCDRPTARRKYATSPWVCPECGQAWQATQQQPDNLAPDVISWWWRRWPLTGEGSVQW